jgi:peptidoglycan/LPS O-acetylase OafA/YrhL
VCHATTVSGTFEKKSIFNLGHVGVLIFFVHTCMVLMLSLERQEKIDSHLLWLRFMVRRVFRIYPLSILIVLITVIFSIPSGKFDYHSISVIPLDRIGTVSNLFLTQNLTLSLSAPAPLWSLPYEIQMYCLLPAMFLLTRKSKSAYTVFGLWIVALSLACFFVRFGLNVRFIERLNLITYAPCFVPGVIAYRFSRSRPVFPSWMWPVVLFLLIGAFEMSPREAWLPQWIVCLSIGILIPLFSEIRNATVNRISHWVAKYSYGIYLSHAFCLWLFFIVGQNLPKALQWLGALSATGALSVVSFHTIEQPMIGMGISLADRLGRRAIRGSTLEVSAKATGA